MTWRNILNAILYKITKRKRPHFFEKSYRVWFDPKDNWFLVFDRNGDIVPHLTNVVVSDNFNETPTAIFTCLVDVVNERPSKEIVEEEISEEIANPLN